MLLFFHMPKYDPWWWPYWKSDQHQNHITESQSSNDYFLQFCSQWPVGFRREEKGKIAAVLCFFYRIYTKITNVHQVHPMIVIALSWSMGYVYNCLKKNTSLFYSKITFQTSWNLCRTSNLWRLLVQRDKLKTNGIIETFPHRLQVLKYTFVLQFNACLNELVGETQFFKWHVV